jgi:hypothetical protein
MLRQLSLVLIVTTLLGLGPSIFAGPHLKHFVEPDSDTSVDAMAEAAVNGSWSDFIQTFDKAIYYRHRDPQGLMGDTTWTHDIDFFNDGKVKKHIAVWADEAPTHQEFDLDVQSPKSREHLVSVELKGDGVTWHWSIDGKEYTKTQRR